MPLWRVDVAGVSTRYVDAESAAHAVDIVRQLLIAAIDLQATRAGTSLQKGYDQAAPAQRRRLLDDLDTLTSPQAIRSARAARRRLARQIRFDVQRRDWVRGQLNGAPPVAPDAAERVIRHVEMGRLGIRPEIATATLAQERALEA